MKRVVTKWNKLRRTGLIASIAFFAYFTIVYPFNGVYSGQLLRSVSGGQTKLVLKQGSAYLKTPSHPLVPIGSYELKDGKTIFSMGGTNLYLITRTLGGIKLTEYSNGHPDSDSEHKLWKVCVPFHTISEFF